MSQQVIQPAGLQGGMQAVKIGAVHVVNYQASNGTSAQSGAVSSDTTMIVLALNTAGAGVRFAVGADPVASASTGLLPSSGWYSLCCSPSDKVAVLSADTATGSVTVMEAASQ